MSETLRAFVAVELPRQVREGLAGLQQEMGRLGKDVVRWVLPEGMHLTLKFLGDMPAQLLPQVTGAVQEAATGASPFVLETDGLGFFPNASRPRVFCVQIKGEVEPLVQLQERLEAAMARLGFPREARSFTPHLTLGRLRDAAAQAERQRFREQVMARPPAEARPFRVEALSLMKSDLLPTGAVYTRLAEARFGAP